jgi:hypothetical protein
MLREPLQTELTAAAAVAAKAGLGVVTPEVLHLGNHTTARLSPLPLIARVASGTSFDFSDGSLGRELDVALHAARREAPSVRPATAVAPGPYIEGKCAVTLWELVDGRGVATEADQRLAATSLKALHSALADITIDLPSFLTKVESCETILTNPHQAPQLATSDRRFLEELYKKLRADLSGVGPAWRPLHGDAHLGNVLITGSGATWMDLEAVCLGPTEWDVATLPVATWDQFPEIDVALTRLLETVRRLCVAVWCWAEFDRSPATQEAAVHHLDELKRRFSQALARSAATPNRTQA